MAQAAEPNEMKMEVDADGGDDRQCKDVIAPPRFPLSHDVLFDAENDGKINLDALTKHLHAEGRLSMDDALSLISETANLFKKEPNLLVLQDPITVCGDIHGQFFDFLRLLEAGGDPAETQYLFLGIYMEDAISLYTLHSEIHRLGVTVYTLSITLPVIHTLFPSMKWPQF